MLSYFRLFRIGTNRNIFYRTSRYSWKDQKDTWNYSCVDGAINTLPLPQDDPDTFQGIEEEDALYECLPGPPPSVSRSHIFPRFRGPECKVLCDLAENKVDGPVGAIRVSPDNFMHFPPRHTGCVLVAVETTECTWLDAHELLFQSVGHVSVLRLEILPFRHGGEHGRG